MQILFVILFFVCLYGVLRNLYGIGINEKIVGEVDDRLVEIRAGEGVGLIASILVILTFSILSVTFGTLVIWGS